MIQYFDASQVARELVPVEVIAQLHQTLRAEAQAYVFVGAAARDLAVHAPSGTRMVRATRDVDVAVGIQAGTEHDALLRRLGEPTAAPQRVRVSGVDVDVIPFAGGTTDVRLGHSVLDVTGLADAAREPTWVKIADDLTVPVASIAAQAVLKVLAWRDRQATTQKDALDFGQILSASSCGLFEDQAWEDDDALTACEGDIILMGPYRVGRESRRLLSAFSAASVTTILDAEPLDLLLRLGVREGDQMLQAFRRGFG
jgi:predicted nucleotidyltransferase